MTAAAHRAMGKNKATAAVRNQINAVLDKLDPVFQNSDLPPQIIRELKNPATRQIATEQFDLLKKRFAELRDLPLDIDGLEKWWVKFEAWIAELTAFAVSHGYKPRRSVASRGDVSPA